MSRAIQAAALLLASVATGAPAPAERPPIELTGDSACGTLSARYVALLESDGGGVILSAAPFPDSSAVDVDAEGRPAEPIASRGALRFAGAATQIHVLRGREIAGGAVGCVGFDKDRFTWASDLLTYVRYLAGLLREAQRLDPGQRALLVSDRIVRLEVRRPGGDFAVLEGVEGSMMGFGSASDEVRYFFVPVLLGASGQSVLVNVLRNRGAAFAEGGMEHLTWVLLEASEPVSTATDPPLTLQRVE
jgi:hypothetical protein